MTLDQLAAQAAEALRKARIFIEYARYELEPELMPGAQFPSQKCADREITRIDAALDGLGGLKVATQALREQLEQARDAVKRANKSACDEIALSTRLGVDAERLRQQLAQATQERDASRALVSASLDVWRLQKAVERAEAAESALTAQREELEHHRAALVGMVKNCGRCKGQGEIWRSYDGQSAEADPKLASCPSCAAGRSLIAAACTPTKSAG